MNKWLRRRYNSLGYGVQSPSDFYFVQHVLREELPYYSYTLIHQLHSQPSIQLPHYDEKTNRLLFRLANHTHPTLVVEVGAGSSALVLGMACPSARCIAITSSPAHADALRASLDSSKESILTHEQPQVEIQNSDEYAVFYTINTLSEAIGLLHIAHTEQYREVLESALPHMADKGLIIIEGIRSSQAKQLWWEELHESRQTGISYDLGNIGLLILDPSRHKESYWINLRR